MKLLICSVFDNAIKAYQAPFYARTKAEAARGFADAVNAQNSQFAKHAADFTLFAIGVFNDVDADIEQEGAHQKIISALECLDEVDLTKVTKIA